MSVIDFERDLAALVNRYSLENGSNTPDYILAGFMVYALHAFELAANRRDKHGSITRPEHVPDGLLPSMEVKLADMPDGWVCFAIGEGKPCMAPPKVADEIRLAIERVKSLERLVGLVKEKNETLEDQRGALENEVAERDNQIYALEQRAAELETHEKAFAAAFKEMREVVRTELQNYYGDDPATFMDVSSSIKAPLEK